ncbi:endonuclease-reverse transcriptase [Elysia marginata]|uniref:Endonuclease-reverse transcriptase n=1 Tax=Elysia marginata TaxID=1093978 RepID=A0AAV4K0L6_9GAST|nr:endonuclease-reverse transcriptase [Elysia marginata]
MGIKALHHLCCQIWKQQEWPEDWKLQEFVMLYKNGNSKECGNYRTIALISHAKQIMRQADIHVNDMGINIGGRDITNLRYADDTALLSLSDNLTSMKRILHRVNNADSNYSSIRLNALQLNARYG